MISFWVAASEPNSATILPLRMTMMREGEPAPTTVFWNPSLIDSTETSTTTTPAMPTIATADEPARCGSVRRLRSVTAPIWVSQDISRLSQLAVPAVIDRLIAAGLDSIPGGGAEILVDRVRRLLHCYGKATADEWLDVMRHAHRAGLRTTATMMYGTVETDEERLEHLLRLRALQDETGGFTAFITWSYQPDHTELAGSEATGIDYLRTLALARIVLDNFDNLQASWVTQGGKVGQLSLAFGANDMGSVMIEENVVRAAGASYCMDEAEIVRNIEDAGFAAKRRNMHYEILGDPICRERDVPRMLELATARADGDTSVPEELRLYPARSRAGKDARQ